MLGHHDPDGPCKALTLGADDAMAAPVHLPELTARLAARLRRAPTDGHQREAVWRQELMFDILEELSAALRSDSIVETLVRRVGLALEAVALLLPTGITLGALRTRGGSPGEARLPEISGWISIATRRSAKRSAPGSTVFIPDLEAHPLFEEIRTLWQELGVTRTCEASPSFR